MGGGIGGYWRKLFEFPKIPSDSVERLRPRQSSRERGTGRCQGFRVGFERIFNRREESVSKSREDR